MLEEPNKNYDVIIVGGGASGLMCAALCGQQGKKVLVLDKANKVGKKILMSGGGRCNFTNLYVTHENYLSNNPHFAKSALSRYTQWDFIALVERYNISYHERLHGELFCDNSAKDILNMLLDECVQGGVQIRTQCDIESIQQNEDAQFVINSNLGNFLTPDLVIASGGLSIPTMGASGFGYQIAEQFGLKVLPRRAGLVPFTFSDQTKGLTDRLSGLAHEVNLSNQRQNFVENILFTHRGISGPAALQLSNYWQPSESISVNLYPSEDLEATLLNAKKSTPTSLLRTVLAKHLSKNLCTELQALFWPDVKDAPIAEISDARLREIAHTLQHWQLKPSGTEGYRTAEVTLGGLDTDQISSKTMECKSVPGLFFIGEVLDVTGHLGGFNFQWAWASAFAASEAIQAPASNTQS
jgi:predicted Rossmann fold flavoprotein